MTLIIWLLAFAVAITIHEFAHAWAADRLGDPTARLAGRLTLNPISHFDPIGTMVLVITALTTPFVIGWAKPVPFDPYNLANPKRDAMLIALAGPAVNIVFAIMLSLILRLFLMEFPLLNVISVAMISLNIMLAIFNLIPIHPLDGGKILAGLLPNDLANEFNVVMYRYGTFILLALLFIRIGNTSAIGALIYPPIMLLRGILIP